MTAAAQFVSHHKNMFGEISGALKAEYSTISVRLFQIQLDFALSSNRVNTSSLDS
jgi:hypothetical protein